MYKNILGVIAIVVGFIGYAPYLRDVFKGSTKPHFFSWFLWGILETTAFFAQIKKGGGAGSWVLGFSALVVFIIAFKALWSGERNITRLDWFGFVGASIGIIIWFYTKDPTGAVIVIALTDAMAFIPTYRKGFQHPNEETAFEYGMSALKYIFGFFALNTYNLATYLYPTTLILTNSVFVIMLLWRRKKLV